MATVESSPLPPPPGIGGQITKITEADRAEMMAQANEVIDYFLNGRGSFTPDGPRKPLVDDPRFDSTVRDLNSFKDSVIAAKGFADDPNHILDSVVDLIRKTIDQIEQNDRDQQARDNISKLPPDTIDPLNNARVPQTFPPDSAPRDPAGKASPGLVQPITLQTPTAFAPMPSPAAFDLSGHSAASNIATPAWPQSLFTQLMSRGLASEDDPRFVPGNPKQAAALLWPAQSQDASQAAPSLQPDETPDATDNGPTRFLVARTYDPSQGWPFAARSVPSQQSPDGSLSLNDAYLEYLKRLNANQSQMAWRELRPIVPRPFP